IMISRKHRRRTSCKGPERSVQEAAQKTAQDSREQREESLKLLSAQIRDARTPGNDHSQGSRKRGRSRQSTGKRRPQDLPGQIVLFSRSRYEKDRVPAL